MKKKLLLAAAALCLCLILASCGSERKSMITGEDDPPAPLNEAGTDFSKYSGRRIGVITGSVQERYVGEKIPGGECVYFDDESAMAVAVTQGKIDTFIIAYKTATELLANYPNLTYDPVPISVDWIAQGFSQNEKGEHLCAQYSEYVNKLKESGELERIREKWHGDPSGWSAPDFSRIENNTEIINYGSVGIVMPICFMGDGEYQGMELDMLLGFCEEYGYKYKLEVVPATSLLFGLSTGSYDMGGGGLAYSEERAKSMLFGPKYYSSPQVFIIPKASSVHEETFFEGVRTEFEKTFVTESRWKLFLSGFAVTILITVCAFVLGAVLGVGVCRMMFSRLRVFNVIADWYVKILQGVPTVVILMILCYVVFARASISGVLVAIIGFALLIGCETGELYYHSINAVSSGQKEAGLAIGLSPTQTFTGIIIPQAMRSILPGYKNCIISVLKATAVAGYIAVQDLTKMSDIIRSRTYSAFFPLISTAVIYFAASVAIARLLEWIIRKTEPAKEGRTIKGVKLHDTDQTS